MKIILSTNGFKIQVSDEDFEYLNQWNWNVDVRNGRPHKVMRTQECDRKIILMSHEILKRQGISFRDDVDHKNRDPLNNQRQNVRPATKSQNQMNRSVDCRNASGYKGVYFHRSSGQFVAQILVKRHKFYLGLFRDPVIAAKAYDKAAKQYHKEFAVLNFPEDV